MGLLEKRLTSDLQFEKYGEQGGGSKKQRKGNIGRADHLRVRVRSFSMYLLVSSLRMMMYHVIPSQLTRDK